MHHFTKEDIENFKDENIAILQIPSKGYSLIAKKNYLKNDLVISSRQVSKSNLRSDHSIQKELDEHILIDIPSILLNHSCEGNLGVLDNENDSYDFIALRDINQGEELTFNYRTTEYHDINLPICLCNSENCEKQILGFKHSPNKIFEKYRPYIPNYIKKIHIKASEI